MRLKVLIFLLTACATVVAQTHDFKPNWDKGTEKTISTAEVEREYRNDELISDTTVYNEVIVRVVDESNSDYTLEVIHENKALFTLIELNEKLGGGHKDYKTLKLLYSIDKETAEVELLNLDEAQVFMNGVFDQIANDIEKETPYLEEILVPIKEVFVSKERVEENMLYDFDFILLPFQHQLQLSETVSITGSHRNSLNPMEEVPSTTILTLKSFDKFSGVCEIDQELKLDLSQFIARMNELIRSHAEAKTSRVEGDSIVTKKEEMTKFELDMTNLQTIHFNSKSTWVEKRTLTVIAEGTDPKDGAKTRIESISTTTVK